LHGRISVLLSGSASSGVGPQAPEETEKEVGVIASEAKQSAFPATVWSTGFSLALWGLKARTKLKFGLRTGFEDQIASLRSQ
jgi:hypothetical protein